MISGNPYRRKPHWGIPWSDAELAALEPYVKGRIKGKYRNSMHAGREFYAAMEESGDGIASRRTLSAVICRIRKRSAGHKWEFCAGWSREELKVVDRHIRSLARARVGRRGIWAIIRSCHSALRRLHAAHPRAVWAQKERTKLATELELHARAGRLRQRWTGAWWTRQENSLIESHAQALARGRFKLSPDAARHCLDELEQLRARDPRVAARTLVGVEDRIRRRARRLGWTCLWSPQELQALEPYAQALVTGECRSATEVWPALLADRRSLRERPAQAVLYALRKRARALGRPPQAGAWVGKEAQRLDWYVNQVVKRRIASATEAARAFLAEREQLRRSSPHANWLNIRRTLQGVLGEICKRVQRLGGVTGIPRFDRASHSAVWTRPELRLLDRYARALANGRYPSVRAAVPLLQRELAELRRQGKGGPKARGYDGIMNKLLARSRELGRRALKLVDFAPEEERVIGAYARAFRKGRYPSVQAAVRACRREFARLRRRRPRPGWLAVSRTFSSIASRLLDVVHEQGMGPLRPRVSAPEQEVIDVYARRVAARELSWAAAARECVEAFARLRERHPEFQWLQYRRTLGSVKDIIRRRSILMQRSSQMDVTSAGTVPDKTAKENDER
jgi:hypothetical protein